MRKGVIQRMIWIRLFRGRAIPICAVVVLLYVIMARWTVSQNPDSEAQSRFLLNLGLTLAVILPRIVTLILSTTHLPAELESRTLYPLLARPVPRSRFLWELWSAVTLAGTAMMLVCSGIAMVVTPSVAGPEGATLLQHLILQAAVLGTVTAIGMALSLLMPQAMALALGLTLTFLGGLIATAWGPVSWWPHLLPQVDLCNLATRYTTGMSPMPTLQYGSLWLHCVIWALLSLWICRHRFLRRAL